MHEFFPHGPDVDSGPAVSPRERLQRTIAELQRRNLERAANALPAGTSGELVDERAAVEVEPLDREVS